MVTRGSFTMCRSVTPIPRSIASVCSIASFIHSPSQERNATHSAVTKTLASATGSKNFHAKRISWS